MKKIPLVKLVIVGLFPILVISCADQITPSPNSKKVMTVKDSLNFFNLDDVGAKKQLPKGKIHWNSAEIRAQVELSPESLRALSDSSDNRYFEVGEWYIPAEIYNNFELQDMPYAVSEEVLEILEGSEKVGVYTYKPDEMRAELKKHGLTTKDIRELTIQDGEISLNDLEILAKKADTSTAGKIVALSGHSYLSALKSRIQTYFDRSRK
jgi:hypothetical protein